MPFGFFLDILISSLLFFFFCYLPKELSGVSCRKHTLQCQSSLLSKNFEKLTQCDQRLYELSLQPDAMLETPGFEPKRSIFENPNDSKDCLGFNGLEYGREASLPKFNDPASPCVISSLSKKGQPINIGNHLWPYDIFQTGKLL